MKQKKLKQLALKEVLKERKIRTALCLELDYMIRVHEADKLEIRILNNTIKTLEETLESKDQEIEDWKSAHSRMEASYKREKECAERLAKQ